MTPPAPHTVRSRSDASIRIKNAVRLVGVRLLTGFVIGIGAIAPGVSGGAMAVIFGLYDRITDAIAHFYRHFFEKMKFLLPLGIGGVLGVLLCGNGIFYLFTYYNTPVRCLFIGLMAGTLPGVFRTANRQGFHRWYWLAFAGGAALTLFLTNLPALQYAGGTEGVSFPLLVLSGAILGFGTIVPGVSSSFILMAAGLYEIVMESIAHVQLPRLCPLMLGFVGVVLLFAKVVDWLYRHAYGVISYTVCGLLAGSMIPVIPPLAANIPSLLAVLLAVFGGALTFLLLRFQEA